MDSALPHHDMGVLSTLWIEIPETLEPGFNEIRYSKLLWSPRCTANDISGT